jgi:hypothetical protein
LTEKGQPNETALVSKRTVNSTYACKVIMGMDLFIENSHKPLFKGCAMLKLLMAIS